MRLAALYMAFLILSLNAFARECDYGVEIIADGDEFDSQDFKWRMRATKIEGKSTNITGTAQIESDGKTIKSYKPWTSESIAKQKTSNEYSPNLKPGNYEITAEISVECDDINKGNNADKKEIKIKGSKEAEEIEEAEPKKKAPKNEETILQEKQVSEPKSQQSKSSSKPKSAPEDFDNVIELKYQDQKAKEAQITSNLIQNPKNTEIAYESSSEKAKRWIMIFLLTLSILLNIILIWKR